MDAVIVLAEGQRLSATLRDISKNGLRVQLLDDEEVRVGENLSIWRGSERWQATVKWVLGSEAGCVFQEPECDSK
jgi:hypothetical protein